MDYLYEPGKKGIRITRVFGHDSRVTIPEKIQGQAVTELGAYLFSDKMDASDARRLLAEGCLFREKAISPDAPAIAGDRVEEVILPETLEKVGRYAFYNCGKLRKISFGSLLEDLGAGALTGCHKVEELAVHTRENGQSCLRDFLTELPEELMVTLVREDACGRFCFPEIFEEGVENTPARILENHVHGSGIRYRNCFQHRVLNIREYDELFAYAVAWENENAVISLALNRMLYPMELGEKAKKRYLEYLGEHMEKAVLILEKQQEYGALGRILEQLRPGQETIRKLLETAENRSDMEAVSVLMNYQHRYVKKGRKVFEL